MLDGSTKLVLKSGCQGSFEIKTTDNLVITQAIASIANDRGVMTAICFGKTSINDSIDVIYTIFRCFYHLVVRDSI